MTTRTRLLLVGTALTVAAACTDGGVTLPPETADDEVSVDSDIAELEDRPPTDRNPGSTLSGGSSALETVFSEAFDPDDEQSSGEGWELLAVREATTARQAVEIGVGDERWAAVWDRFDFAGDPPPVDHDRVVPVIATFDSDCPVILADVAFADDTNGPVRILAQTPDTCEQFVEASRTIAIAIDRERLPEDRFAIDAGTSQSVGAVELTATDQPQPPRGQEPDLPLDTAGIPAGESLVLELGTTADADIVIDDAIPDEPLSVGLAGLRWDGVQWIALDELPDVAIDERPGNERSGQLELDTGSLQPGTYWFQFNVVPPSPFGTVATTMIRVLE